MQPPPHSTPTRMILPQCGDRSCGFAPLALLARTSGFVLVKIGPTLKLLFVFLSHGDTCTAQHVLNPQKQRPQGKSTHGVRLKECFTKVATICMLRGSSLHSRVCDCRVDGLWFPTLRVVLNKQCQNCKLIRSTFIKPKQLFHDVCLSLYPVFFLHRASLQYIVLYSTRLCKNINLL